MSYVGFHVTHESNVDDIKKTGLAARDDGEWRRKRKELRKKVDEYANNRTNGWVNRQRAIYFWTTIEDALDFIQTHFEGRGYVIISVDLSGLDVWRAESEFMEDLYYDWMNNGHIEYDLSKLEQKTSKWNGKKQTGTEVWCQGPISSKRITDIQ